MLRQYALGRMSTVFGALTSVLKQRLPLRCGRQRLGFVHGATCRFLADGDLFEPICGHALVLGTCYSALLWR